MLQFQSIQPTRQHAAIEFESNPVLRQIMPCVSKLTCTHVIIISLWLICNIQCRFSISYLSISGIAAHEDVIFPMILLFLFSFNVVLGLILLFWFVLSSILYVSVCVSISCALTFFLCYRIKNSSSILCQLFWPTSFLWQQHLEMFLKFTIFSFIWESVSKIQEKCGTIGVHS